MTVYLVLEQSWEYNDERNIIGLGSIVLALIAGEEEAKARKAKEDRNFVRTMDLADWAESLEEITSLSEEEFLARLNAMNLMVLGHRGEWSNWEDVVFPEDLTDEQAGIIIRLLDRFPKIHMIEEMQLDLTAHHLIEAMQQDQDKTCPPK